MILLDTHSLVWLVEGDPELGERTRALIGERGRKDSVGVSAISFWEVAMLEVKGRLRLTQPPLGWRSRILEAGIVEVPVTGEVGIAAAQLQGFRGDPADRIVVATATLQRAVLVTADQSILGWPGPLSRHDARE